MIQEVSEYACSSCNELWKLRQRDDNESGGIRICSSCNELWKLRQRERMTMYNFNITCYLQFNFSIFFLLQFEQLMFKIILHPKKIESITQR